MKVVNDCINHLIDGNGYEYYIPNYCINDPYFEKELNQDKPDEEILTLIVYEVSQNISVPIKISNTDTGLQLKKSFWKVSKIKKNSFNLRLFYGGNEIKDNHQLFQHKLKNDYKIQVMKTPVIHE